MRPINYPDSYLVLELSNRCPLRCGHCIQAEYEKHALFHPAGFADPQMVAGLLRDLAENGIRFQNFIMFWLGEPLLHPNFIDIYRNTLEHNARHHTFDQIEVHTNAIYLTDELADVVLGASGLKQKWHFSLDAITRDVYTVVKGDDQYERVMKNVRRFVKKKAERGVKYPRVAYQFIVRRENRHEVKPFSDYWLSYMEEVGLSCSNIGYGVPGGDDNHVFFRLFDALDFNEQEEANEIYRVELGRLGIEPPVAEKPESLRDIAAEIIRKVTPKERNICSGPWKSPVVNWDGRVTVCTRDSGFHNIVGNIKEQPFSELWWRADAAHRQRIAQIEGDWSKIPFCEGCIIPWSHNYTGIGEEEVRQYRARLRRQEKAPRPGGPVMAAPGPGGPPPRRQSATEWLASLGG
ncbi:MAG: hypothetical protein GMKNLPBB_02892 [Myxococcota bacterium]|nr:hypothetical protein [Myxococcota bacterium]